MTASIQTRILLWNAVSMADELGAALSFPAESAASLSKTMGEESERFTWTVNPDATVSFIRKEEA